jgi:hypothetical protein
LLVLGNLSVIDVDGLIVGHDLLAVSVELVIILQILRVFLLVLVG